MSALYKYGNLSALFASYLCSRATGTSVHWGMPSSLGIELTNHCNLKCRHCASGSGLMKRDKGFMQKEIFQKIIRELSPYTLTTMFYFQGESMMHPQFFEMLNSARDMGPVISTNGHFLDRAACSELARLYFRKIVVSLDGISEYSYSSYRRGGDLEVVLDGIGILSEELKLAGRISDLTIQVLVNSYNENELDELQEFADGVGATIRFKSMQLTGKDDDAGFLPSDSRFKRYNLEDGKLRVRSRMPDYCWRLWSNPVITWDGLVLPCCFDKDAGYVMGDIKSSSFREIWRGDNYRAFRTRLLNNRAGIDICNNCSEGLSGGIRT